MHIVMTLLGCTLSSSQVSVAGLRQHLPGPHPDENLYATSNMPLGPVTGHRVVPGESVMQSGYPPDLF